MYRYLSYGLGIHSAVRLTEVPQSDAPRDIVVRYGEVNISPPAILDQQPYVDATAHEVCLYWDFVGGICVREGHSITVDPLPGVEQDLIAAAIQGVAMGILLHQRGIFTLHASAVAVEEGVVAFIGWKGAGKSTTAAAMHARGHAVVTDDILALRLGPDPTQVEVLSGVSAFKLWPDAAEVALGDVAESFPELYRESVKRYCRTEQGPTLTSLPLRCIYVLEYATDEDSQISISAVPLRQACVELIRHSYALRFLTKEGASPEHLLQCSQLAQHVPLRCLRRKASLAQLADLAERIEQDALQIDDQPVLL